MVRVMVRYNIGFDINNFVEIIIIIMKKALRGDAKTLRTGCSKVEPKISPRRRPLPGGTGRPKFNQLEMVTTFTYKPSLVRIDARSFELSW